MKTYEVHISLKHASALYLFYIKITDYSSATVKYSCDGTTVYYIEKVYTFHHKLA